jgi:cytochrome c oxidase subunit 2
MLQAILAASEPTFWLPKGASTVSGDVDMLFNVVLWICIFFFVLVTVLLVLFVVMYRHRTGVKRSTAAGHSTMLELTWTLIPSIIVVFLYYYGFRQYMNMAIEPPNSYEVTAVGKMWQWSFRYSSGVESSELHVPIGRPVRVVLESNDVIHSLYIPAFRVKKDVVPGRFNRLWFQATDAGTYDIYCTAYCGTNHSTMRSAAVVESQADFDKWMETTIKESNKGTPAEKGAKVYRTQGCAQCHTLDGAKLVGPTWKDLWGRMEKIAGGPDVKVDAAYVIESIRAPQAKIVLGYPASMPPFQLKDADIANLIEFMKTISANTSAADMAAPTTGPATQPAGPSPIAPTVPGTTPSVGSTPVGQNLPTPTTQK